MSVLHEANQRLLSDLFKIYPELQENTRDDFGNEEVSSPVFSVEVGPRQAAASSSSPSSTLTIHSGDYAYNAARAVARIVRILDGVVTSSFATAQAGKLGLELAKKNGNGRIIRQCFKYLDKVEWIPKVVDEQTYQLAQALQIYVSTLLAPENNILDFSVAGGSQTLQNYAAQGKEQLHRMSINLEARIQAYEVNIKDFDRKLAFYELKRKVDNAARALFQSCREQSMEISEYALDGNESDTELASKEAVLQRIAEELKPETGSRYQAFNSLLGEYKGQMAHFSQELQAPAFKESFQTNTLLIRMANAILRHSQEDIEREKKQYEGLLQSGLLQSGLNTRLHRQHIPEPVELPEPKMIIASADEIADSTFLMFSRLTTRINDYLSKCEAVRAVGRLFREHYPESRDYPLPAEFVLPVSLPSSASPQEQINARIEALRALEARLEQYHQELETARQTFEAAVSVPADDESLFELIIRQKNRYLTRFGDGVHCVEEALERVRAESAVQQRELSRYDANARAMKLNSLERSLQQMTAAVIATERAHGQQNEDYGYVLSEENNRANQLRSDIAALEAQHASSEQRLVACIGSLKQIAQEKVDPLQLKADIDAFIGADPKRAFGMYSEEQLLSMFQISAITDDHDELASNSGAVLNSDESILGWFTGQQSLPAELKQKWDERAQNRLKELEPVLAEITAREDRLKQALEPLEETLRLQAARLAELRQELADVESVIAVERQALDDSSVRQDFVRLRRDMARYELDYAKLDDHLIAVEKARQDLQNQIAQEPGDAVDAHINVCQALLQAIEPDAAMKQLLSELPARREELYGRLAELPAHLAEQSNELRTRLDMMSNRTLPDLAQDLEKQVSDRLEALRNELSQSRQALSDEGSPSIEASASPNAHQTSTPLSPDSEGELSLDESDGPISVVEEKRVTPLPKSLGDYYVYANKPRRNVHFWAPASANRDSLREGGRTFHFLAPDERNLTEDGLKAKILEYFKSAIERCETPDELNKCEEDIRNRSIEYQIIITSQGLLTSLVGKTDSLKATNEMVRDKYEQLNSGLKL